MLTVIIGNLGSGKTLFLTYLATKMPDRTIYSNFNINLPNVKPLKADKLLNVPDDIELFLDEGYTWLESRVSSSQFNRYLTYLLYQSRKRSNNFYITLQDFSTMDKRFRRQTDLLIIAQKSALAFKYLFIDYTSFKTYKYKLPFHEAQKLFSLYDTTEVIESKDKARLDYNILKQNPKALLKTVEKIAAKIKNDINGKITHAKVKIALLEHGHDTVWESLVYSKLKQEEEIKKKKFN